MRTPCQTAPEAWVSNSDKVRADAAKECHTCPVFAECKAGKFGTSKFGVIAGTDYGVGREKQPAGPKPIAHGTPAGYRAHFRRKVDMCDACRLAQMEHKANKRADKKRAA